MMMSYFDEIALAQINKKTYEQGLEDAWEVLRKLQKMPCTEFYKLFPCCEGSGNAITELIRRMTPAETIAKIKSYEEEQQKIEQEIKVGDEVIYQYDDREKTGIVYDVMNFPDGNVYKIFSPFEFCPTGSATSESDKVILKTGRHFPQVEELLKAMKEK